MPEHGDLDLVGEPFEPDRNLFTREPVTGDERVRRTTMIVLAVVYGLMFVLNIGFALSLPPGTYAAVGAIVGSGMSVVAGLLGAAIAYYFTKK